MRQGFMRMLIKAGQEAVMKNKKRWHRGRYAMLCGSTARCPKERRKAQKHLLALLIAILNFRTKLFPEE